MGNAATTETMPEEIIQETPQETIKVEPETAAITDDDLDERMLAAWTANNPTTNGDAPADEPERKLIFTPIKMQVESDSAVTVDMLNLNSSFACPLCKAEGINFMINLNTLSEHARSHRNESDTDEDESEYTDDESEYSDEDEDTEENAAIEREVADINAAIRESAMESEIMGNMNEDDALAAALALSNEDQPKLETRFGGMVITPNETDAIDCNDVNCD